MKIKIIHDKNSIYEFLKDKSRYDFLYQFYDLEESNWNNVICFGLTDGDELKQIAMLLTNYDIPVLLAASYNNIEYSTELLAGIKTLLPAKFYTHIDKDVLLNVFSHERIHDMQEYTNMGLEGTAEIINSDAVQLGYERINEIKDLLSFSYPEAWLDDELVKLARNYGIYNNGKLISFAGIHAYSEEFQVAAVAHVTTHPDFRRQGYGEKVVATLINDLRKDIKYIGLNVKTDNKTAINCYKRLGFKEYGKFVACEII